VRFKQSLLVAHRWAGLISGIVILIVSLTGAVFVFETEIFSLLHGKLIHVESKGRPMLPASCLLVSGQAALGLDVKAGWIEGFGPDRSVQVGAYKADDSAGGIWYWDRMKVWKSVFVDPYSGETLGVVDRRFEFFQVVRQIHQNMLLRYDYGHWIVGVTVLVFIAMLITGLILWLPRNRSALRQRLKFAWGAGRRRLLFDLHVVSGIYIWIPVFIVAATGLTWSFTWWSGSLNYLLSGNSASPWSEGPVFESLLPDSAHTADSTKVGDSVATVTKVAAIPVAVSGPPAGPIASMHPIDIAFNEAMRRSRAGGSYYVSLPGDPKGTYDVSYEEPVKSGWLTWSELKFDQYSGKLLHSDLFADKDTRKRFVNSTYDIHVGKIYGWPTMILAELVCLLCAMLPITGFLMWRGKRKRPQTTR
jgi:uncharacterized iron-regulated membrane protein